MRAKHVWLLPCGVLAVLLLSSCSLLPEEETPRSAPILRSYEGETFDFAFVERGDLVLSERISCTYVPVQSASLSFGLGGEYVDEIFVHVGDAVEEGQLLGQLELSSIEEQIASAENSIAELRLRLEYLEEERALALRQAELSADPAAEPQALQEALILVEEEYDARRQSYEDSLYLQELTLETLNRRLSERQIRAPFAGTVTYVRNYSEGARSVFGENAVTVADSTLSLFRADTDQWARFSPGDEVDVVVSNDIYPAIVRSEEELGLAPQEKLEGETAYVYFALKEPSFDLEDGDRGSVTLVLDERHDVLLVPSDAVSSASGQPIVYYQNEEGMKAYKPVETGLTANKQTEIISGLVEGESIIVD